MPGGPYLGQTPPGLVAEPFAPGIVSTNAYEYGVTMAPDLSQIVFIRGDGAPSSQQFISLDHRDGRWRERVMGPRLGQPFFSPDGETVHLGGGYARRAGEGWAEVQPLGLAFAAYEIMRLTASSAGTYVFDEIGSPAGDGLIRISRRIDGVQQAPQALPAEINTGTFNAHPFLAPDESFMLWDGRREAGYGNSDIYVSFRTPDGAWGEAINLGAAVNTDAWEASASVTPDGRFILFHRMVDSGPEGGLPDVDVYWVDAAILDALRAD